MNRTSALLAGAALAAALTGCSLTLGTTTPPAPKVIPPTRPVHYEPPLAVLYWETDVIPHIDSATRLDLRLAVDDDMSDLELQAAETRCIDMGGTLRVSNDYDETYWVCEGVDK